MTYNNVMAIQAPSGRWAILARNNYSAPWHQVESVRADSIDDEEVVKVMEAFESNDDVRLEVIESESGDATGWGQDAPTIWPLPGVRYSTLMTILGNANVRRGVQNVVVNVNGELLGIVMVTKTDHNTIEFTTHDASDPQFRAPSKPSPIDVSPEGMTIIEEATTNDASLMNGYKHEPGYLIPIAEYDKKRHGEWVVLVGPSGYRTTPFRMEMGRWYSEYRPFNPWRTHSNDAFTDGGEPPEFFMMLPYNYEDCAL